jgi:homoserine O-acetyltransferase
MLSFVRRSDILAGACMVAMACGGDATARDDGMGDPLLDPTADVWQEPAPDTFLVVIETTKGAFTIQAVREWAPIGADRFYNLVRNGFYDDSRFYRVVPGFIVQFGLPGDPEVTRHWLRTTIPDDPVSASNTRGTIAYAMTGPDTRTTQVYISLADNSRLDEQGFAPFGRIIEGMNVVDRLYGGYGEEAGGGLRRGDQSRIYEEGNAHLDAEFPQLDRLVRAAIVGGEPRRE